jgi:hypothetical protein
VSCTLPRRPLQVDREVEGAREVEEAHRQEEQDGGRNREFDQGLSTLLLAWPRFPESIEQRHQEAFRPIRAVAVVLIAAPGPNIWG